MKWKLQKGARRMHWNGTICSSSEGNPPLTPPPPSPSPPISCGSITGAKECKDIADCEWFNGIGIVYKRDIFHITIFYALMNRNLLIESNSYTS